eukprot:11177879-Lingulodinium_polyedra.AAC.1
MRAPLEAWAAGGALAPVGYPTLRAVGDGYQQLRTTMDSDLPAREEAVPRDMLREPAGDGPIVARR